jgi:mono/diheme cytochrome c family protein
MPAVNRSSKVAVLATAVAVSALAGGCGSGGADVDDRGAQLFAERCSGCHTLEAAGAEGSIAGGQRPTGPNLDKRKLSKEEALYAIRNGGFSGAIMPQNIVVGEDAEAVAEFLAKYAGSEATSPPSPKGSAQGGGGESTEAAGAGAGGEK